jgi:hypothetical protein
MSLGFQALLKGFNLNAPATEQEIHDFEGLAGLTLPIEYVEFLRVGNGGEGFIGENAYAMLWRVEELERFNREYEVQQYAPGLLLIGSDGGGEALAYDRRQTPWVVVQVPFVGMDLAHVEVLGDSFRSFLEALYSAE